MIWTPGTRRGLITADGGRVPEKVKSGIIDRGWIDLDEDEDFYGTAKLPDGPTDAEPGSDEKIELMALRYEQRRQLHHPDDRRVTSRISRVLPGNFFQISR
jgi:hypothetical protein